MDNGTRCTSCQAKGWRGLNHEEKECFNKKRDKKGKKDRKTNKSNVHEEKHEESDSDKGITIAQIRVGSAGTRFHENMCLFMYDTGASHATTNNRKLLHDVNTVNLSVKGHDGQKTTCTTIGTMTIKHHGKRIKQEETLFHETYSNLIRGQRLPPHTMIVEQSTAEIRLKGKKGILYKMTRDEDGGNWIKPDELTHKVGTVEAAKQMHERYAHISDDTLRTLPNYSRIYQGLQPRCEPCEKRKATKPTARDQAKGQGKVIRSTRRLERRHADLVGPITPVTPKSQFKYLLVVIDDYRRYIITKALLTKGETTEGLMEIITALETACGKNTTVRTIEADWGGEFRNQKLEEKLRQRGTTLKETIPHYSETNPVVERGNPTIFTMYRTAFVVSG